MHHTKQGGLLPELGVLKLADYDDYCPHIGLSWVFSFFPVYLRSFFIVECNYLFGNFTHLFFLSCLTGVFKAKLFCFKCMKLAIWPFGHFGPVHIFTSGK